MSRVLILSSWVAHGHVGLSAAAPALQALGHGVTQLPTVLLSNHPGWPHVAGRPVPVADLSAMIAALEANGWLHAHDAVLTGYMPSPDHVALAVALIARLRAQNPAVRVVVDPILGDDPGGLYVPDGVAAAIRDTLVPLADILTPNAFELGWLTGRTVATRAAAQAAAAGLGARAVLVTSCPALPGRVGTLWVTRDCAAFWQTQRHAHVPHGTGDVLAGLIAAGCAPGAALGHLGMLIADSTGAPHLAIAESAPRWTRATPLSPDPED